jgi:D-tyrosyl-tRNA(Tyr) deacylase
VRVVVQRVARAAVRWTDPDGAAHGSVIGRGFLLLVGVGPEDADADVDRMAEKVVHLRVFPDDEGRSNRSLEDVSGEALVVSQFTLYADTTRGRRPSFIRAGDPARAEELYGRLAAQLEAIGIPTRTGRFGAQMSVSLENDGPVTLVLSTHPWETRISR